MKIIKYNYNLNLIEGVLNNASSRIDPALLQSRLSELARLRDQIDNALTKITDPGQQRQLQTKKQQINDLLVGKTLEGKIPDLNNADQKSDTSSSSSTKPDPALQPEIKDSSEDNQSDQSNRKNISPDESGKAEQQENQNSQQDNQNNQKDSQDDQGDNKANADQVNQNNQDENNSTSQQNSNNDQASQENQNKQASQVDQNNLENQAGQDDQVSSENKNEQDSSSSSSQDNNDEGEQNQNSQNGQNNQGEQSGHKTKDPFARPKTSSVVQNKSQTSQNISELEKQEMLVKIVQRIRSLPSDARQGALDALKDLLNI